MLSADATTSAPTPSRPAPKKGDDLTNRDLSWFARRVERGRREMFAEVVAITPEIARRLLEQNHDNRRVNDGTVRDVARDLTNNRWRLNGETIKVDKDGGLIDGQNRLSAIVRADKPAQAFVIFGLDRKSRETVDMGKARTTPQFLGMRGEQNTLRMSACARLQLSYLSGSATYQSGVYTRQDVIACFDDWCEKLRPAQAAVGNLRFVRNLSGGSFVVVAYMNIKLVDPVNCELFFEKLCNGYNLEPDDPVLKLRERLIEGTRKGVARMNEMHLEVILRYWNVWAQGKSVPPLPRITGTFPPISHADRQE